MSSSTMMGRERLDYLWQRGLDFLGTEYAILAGAMSWVSERNLVSAISNAGGFGVIACGGMNPEQLSAEIDATKELTDKPFAVNLITLHPDLDALIDVCVANTGADTSEDFVVQAVLNSLHCF